MMRKPRRRRQTDRRSLSRVHHHTSGGLTRRSLVVVFALGFIIPFIVIHHVRWNTDGAFKLRASHKNQQQEEDHDTTVHFLHAGKHINNDKDLFSASWLMPVSAFLDFDTSGKNLPTAEAGSYALFKRHHDKVRMTLDWLDFSVEHLSSYWDAIDALKVDDNVPFHVLISKLHAYIRNIWMNENERGMQDTIAVVAFEPLQSRRKPHAANELTVASLAATVASLVQAGFGRVVVVGYNADDEELVDDAFRLLLTLVPNDTTGNTTNALSQIGRTELAYVRAATEDVISQKTPINIVKGALTGLQKALKGDGDSMSAERQHGSSWKYVYLTEPDTILQTKPSALPQLQKALVEGLILAPHRLQPLPHEYDLAGMKNSNKMVHAVGNFSLILQLNSLEGAVCCDQDYKPWKEHPKCNSFWWQCGFNDRKDHSRLEQYDLIRLQPGMGIVSLAANHNGRRCKPNTSGVCVPVDISG